MPVNKPLAVSVLAAICSGCVDQANTPTLLPIGHPPNPPWVAHTFCAGDAKAMYNEAKSQYELRLQMTGYAEADPINEEEQAKAAAYRKYVSCVASQGYRAVN
ncbi:MULTISPECIES: hypothetical protein [unclassified Sinorhizobium]|uniref:hypothetical protein n=1 Tax=unclassified Sinorhizobium TaxID=2613772 RepID=UPI003526A181